MDTETVVVVVTELDWKPLPVDVLLQTAMEHYEQTLCLRYRWKCF